jgi:hypothetical protein
MFMLDHWDVMGGKREKLAGMNALRNSYETSLHREVMQIVDNYAPDGFYFDNGAFVWQDYDSDTEWTAFDDDGRVYTNAGIAYAILQDMLAARAPQIHRNPGEHIQYFSGFRGNSHLSNNTGGQRYYVRSHRLIMGYKPIFPGHPRNIVSRATLYDYLEFGGLPWMAGMRTQGERLAQAWAPVAIALARAGWRGRGHRQPRRPRPTLRRRRAYDVHRPQPVRGPGFDHGHDRWWISHSCRLLRTPGPDARGGGRPDAADRRVGRRRDVVPHDPPADATRRTLAGGGLPRHRRARQHCHLVGCVRCGAPHGPPGERLCRVAGGATGQGACGGDSADAADLRAAGDTLTLSFGDEEEGRRLLSDYLDTLAVPLSDEPAKWEP